MKCDKCNLRWPLRLFEVYSAKRRNGTRELVRCGHCMYCAALDSQVVRHRKRGDLPDFYTPDYVSWATKVRACNHRCPSCRKRRRLTIDHIVPFSRGGQFSIGNFAPLCKSCNSSKRDKILAAY